MRKIYFILGLGLLLLISCHTSKTDLKENNMDFEQQITEKYWKLTSWNGPVKMIENQEREVYFILKTEGNRVKGFGGCNNFMGFYRLKENRKIEFQPMASTLKACPDVDFDESGFLKMFERVSEYEIHNDQLILVDKSGETLSNFEAVYF